MLVEVGRRLTDWAATEPARPIRGALSVARVGGDAFGVLLTRPAVDATAAADRLLHAFDAPFTVEGRQLSITVSIGIASTGGRQGTSATELLRAADVALYEAKADGRNRSPSSTCRCRRAPTARLSLEQDLRAAIRAGHIRLHFQPISRRGLRRDRRRRGPRPLVPATATGRSRRTCSSRSRRTSG